MKPFYILGAGGHGRCVLEAAKLSGLEVAAILDDHPACDRLLGVPVWPTAEVLRSDVRHGNYFRFVVAIGDCAIRRQKFEGLLALGGEPQTVIHPRAYVSPSAQIGAGSVLMHFSTADSLSRIGRNVILNIGSIVAHDCIVEDHAHISANATLCGGAHVHAGAWVGAGASVRQHQEIGFKAFVGLGATVVKDVPPNATVCNPVRARDITERLTSSHLIGFR